MINTFDQITHIHKSRHILFSLWPSETNNKNEKNVVSSRV